MNIHNGDLYWARTSESDFPHPHVVIQVERDSLTLCALTSNLKKVNMPGNVLLDVGEANLIRQSVVEVSKTSTIDTTQLGDYIGTLSQGRVEQILAGMRFVDVSFRNR